MQNLEKIYAHSVEQKPSSEWETLEEHSKRVANAARKRAEPFGAGDFAEIIGLLHDIGKLKPGFQRKLRGEINDVSHSGEGAKALWGTEERVLSAAIAGHHGRLLDENRLKSRIEAAEDIALPDWCKLPTFKWPDRIHTCKDGPTIRYRVQFFVRMLYGALCDADDRETAAFYAGKKDKAARVLEPEMNESFYAFTEKLNGTGMVNALRRKVLAHSLSKAAEAVGLFTLTVPTGGGKTLTSLGFGLEHAKIHGLQRIIFVVPYTSIIEQTADVFRQVLGHENVLEHHSNFDWNGVDENEIEQRRVMGTSWDVPVVVTTAVQFFESLHAARKKRCRKLPSLARSVIILDEAQTMPLALMRPCLAALRELIDGYGASIVLSTATQPALTKAGGFPAKEALEGAREIAPDPDTLFQQLKRVEVLDVGEMKDESLAKRIRGADQVLCILDNRLQARKLFDWVRDEDGAAHLSTLMVPAHRRSVLAEIRKRLKEEDPVRLVSTSLIEAGVDVDFPLVLRAAAGIDSIAQAAGRCNREGKLDLGKVEVFRPEHPAPAAIEQFAVIGRKILSQGLENPISQAAVSQYFRQLWFQYGSDALDSKEVEGTRGILNAIGSSGNHPPYEQIEKAFQMISEGQHFVIIQDGEWGISEQDLENLKYGNLGTTVRTLQSHCVNVPRTMWERLWADGHLAWWATDQFGEQFALLQTSDLYDPRAGLSLENEIGAIV